jgi:hypothetical protein
MRLRLACSLDPHPPLRGTFSRGEKVAEGRMRGKPAAPLAENETSLPRGEPGAKFLERFYNNPVVVEDDRPPWRQRIPDPTAEARSELAP